MKVFLVDDSDSVRTRLHEALSELPGVEVSTCAPRAGGVISLIAERRPDVVVVDIQMTRGGALDLIHKIKAGTRPPVVIALSSSPSLQYRAMCHKAGAEYFFDKVHEQDMLSNAIVDLKEELGC